MIADSHADLMYDPRSQQPPQMIYDVPFMCNCGSHESDPPATGSLGQGGTAARGVCTACPAIGNISGSERDIREGEL